MIHKTSWAVLVTALFIWGCGNAPKTETTSEHQHEAGHNHETHAGHDHGKSGENQSLWQANPETTTGISNMQNRVQQAIDNQETSYAKLSTDLDAEFQAIIQQCTMTGAAHDALHEFLIPLKERIDGLAKSGSPETVQELSEYLKTYSTQFQ